MTMDIFEPHLGSHILQVQVLFTKRTLTMATYKLSTFTLQMLF